MGDNMQYYKYILRNAANPHNRTVTFWPVSPHEIVAKLTQGITYAGIGISGLLWSLASAFWRAHRCAAANVFAAQAFAQRCAGASFNVIGPEVPAQR
jgi:hypothetical protein